MLCSKCVWQIERVQNMTLWQSYQLMKKQLEVKNKHTNNERQLFHGTGADSIDLINHRGFNRSYAGKHGNKPTYQYQNQYPQSDTVLDYPAVLAQSRVTLNRTMVAVIGCEKNWVQKVIAARTKTWKNRFRKLIHCPRAICTFKELWITMMSSPLRTGWVKIRRQMSIRVVAATTDCNFWKKKQPTVLVSVANGRN